MTRKVIEFDKRKKSVSVFTEPLSDYEYVRRCVVELNIDEDLIKLGDKALKLLSVAIRIGSLTVVILSVIYMYIADNKWSSLVILPPILLNILPGLLDKVVLYLFENIWFNYYIEWTNEKQRKLIKAAMIKKDWNLVKCEADILNTPHIKQIKNGTVNKCASKIAKML